MFLITSINVFQDDEFMQRKEKAIKTVTDIFVSMLDFYDQETSGFSNEMVLVNAAWCSQSWIFSWEGPN